MRRASPLVLFALACLAACAPSGDDPRNRMTTWVSPGGEATIFYLAPPWELERTLDNGVALRVPSNANLAGGLEGGPGKFELVALVEAGNPNTRIVAERAAALVAGREILDERELFTAEEVAGPELVLFDPGAEFRRFRRVLYLPLSGGRALRVEVIATTTPDTPEVTEMLRLIEVDVAP